MIKASGPDLHHQLRRGDVAAAIPKLADDHIGYGGAPAHLASPSGQQDGVDFKQAGQERGVIEQAGVLQHSFEFLRRRGAGGHDRR